MSSDLFDGLEELKKVSLISLRGGSWDKDLLEELFNGRDVELIRRIPLSKRDVPDRITWKGEESGKFSVKSCYRRLTGELNRDGWVGWTAVWNWDILPKIKTLFWQICSGTLPTTANLRRRLVACAERCGLCGAEDESLIHLFVLCPDALKAWESVGWSFGWIQGLNFSEWLQQVFDSNKGDELRKVAWGCWGIWSERNRRVWQGEHLDPQQFMHKVWGFVDSWQAADVLVFYALFRLSLSLILVIKILRLYIFL
ncbi:unnamed protein product [Cuscuta europaea]|uniref:Reverse transcriptase zinc-binding domain-containing protein n=1 Tax=Cuscuta europaea TaxID=41803 RepID=A0A9P0ZWK2_CUSEU|nr:unnamed protein product [Cuscuta europaea]